MLKNIRRRIVGSKRAERRAIPDRDLSWLSIYGVWLEEAGFKKGDTCYIEVKKNELIIRNYGKIIRSQ